MLRTILIDFMVNFVENPSLVVVNRIIFDGLPGVLFFESKLLKMAKIYLFTTSILSNLIITPPEVPHGMSSTVSVCTVTWT